MAKTVTRGLSHYRVQKDRRRAQAELWRSHQTAIVRGSDVVLENSPARRTRRGIYKGPEGERLSVLMDASVHEVPSGVVTTTHRHSWDAIMFVLEGRGWTEIGGKRIHWEPWDMLHLPTWAWHRHGNDGPRDARFFTWSMEPMLEWFQMATLEDAGDESPADLPEPPTTSYRGGLDADEDDDPYVRRIRRLTQADDSARDARLHTAWNDVRHVVSERGARSAFLVDESLGYRTSGLSAVMHEMAPGLWQARHRHGGEAHLLAVSGRGHTVVDDESIPWEPGDLVVVDHWCWHQHCNDDDTRTARVVRVHSTLGEIMSALLDPLAISEENPEKDRPNLSGVVWPDPNEGRPTVDPPAASGADA